MQHALNYIAGLLSGGRENAFSFPWHTLRYQHTTAVRAKLAETYKAATVNKMLAALCRVLKESWRLGQISAEEYHRAVDLPSVRSQTLPKGRSVKDTELTRLLDACEVDISPTGRRDAVMLAVLYAAGLRRSELVKLDLKDYNLEVGSLLIRDGKGGKKDRMCYLSGGAAEALADWLTVRGVEAGPLFLPISKASNLMQRRLTTQAVLYILGERVKESGIAECSPHDFRRSFISDLLDAGADIATVQKLAGHANVTTTARYDRLVCSKCPTDRE
jgi:site-specific recombinase XerD